MGKSHENNHDNVGDEIGERVHGIGNHCGTITDKSGNELEQHQQEVGDGAYYSCSVDFLFFRLMR